METRVVQMDAVSPDVEKVGAAAAVVDRGGLVAFPTETVYGIACRARADSIARLDEVKGRSEGKAYTLHIADRSEVRRYISSVGMRAEKLIDHAWPGPLTIVFELDEDEIKKQRGRVEDDVFEILYRNSSVGIRCPDNPIAAALLRKTANAVVAPSANLPGEAPAVDAAGVLAQLSGRIDLLLDGGPCKYRMSSTVVKLGKNGLDILRIGAYSERELEAVSQIKFLFVCTGNTCRSPMAEGMFRKYLAEKLGAEVDRLEQMGYKVSSAGTIDVSGSPASPEAKKTCANRGIDISAHRSRRLSSQLVAESDLIYTMSGEHRERVIAMSRQSPSKCVLIADDKDIPDPLGQGQDVYERCADSIERAVKKRIGELVI
jgi:L-threonylcarbamoyladenylate synthase